MQVELLKTKVKQRQNLTFQMPFLVAITTSHLFTNLWWHTRPTHVKVHAPKKVAIL